MINYCIFSYFIVISTALILHVRYYKEIESLRKEELHLAVLVILLSPITILLELLFIVLLVFIVFYHLIGKAVEYAISNVRKVFTRR